MAIIEQTRIRSIEVLPLDNAVNISWLQTFTNDDGIVVSENYFRKAYGADQRAEFLEEVKIPTEFIDSVIAWEATPSE